MKKESHYVTFDQAKWLKEKEFNLETKWAFDVDGKYYKDEVWDIDYNSSIYNCYSAPQQWQVVEWLENKELYISVYFNADIINSWKLEIINFISKVEDWSDGEIVSSWKKIYQKHFAINDKKYRFNIEKYPNNEKYNIKTYTKQEVYSVAFDYILNNNII